MRGQGSLLALSFFAHWRFLSRGGRIARIAIRPPPKKQFDARQGGGPHPPTGLSLEASGRQYRGPEKRAEQTSPRAGFVSCSSLATARAEPGRLA